MASYRHIEELIPKKVWLLQYENKRTQCWYCKVYTGNRKYAVRSLKTEDKEQAKEKAYEMFAEILTQIKTTGSASPLTVRNLCDKWIRRQESRHTGGKLSATLYRAHRFLFGTYVPNYADFKGWNFVKDIPYDGWEGYRRWRLEEGWKLIGQVNKGGKRKSANKNRKPPLDSTLNREVTMIQEWFKYMLVPERLAKQAPIIEKVKKGRNEENRKKANPAFTPEDYTRIQRRFRKWANDTSAAKPEWRQVVYLFFLCSANCGWRPDSEGLEMKWNQLKIRKRETVLPKGETKTEWIANLEIWDRKNGRQRTGNFLGGEYFQRLLELYERWSIEKSGFHRPSKSSYIFCDPATGKRLSYTTVSNAYKSVLQSLNLKGEYTFYSCRAFYVTERLKEGVEIYTVAKQTGHSMEICKKHYEELHIQERADEATRRTYGKKKADAGVALL
jgi:integrase